MPGDPNLQRNFKKQKEKEKNLTNIPLPFPEYMVNCKQINL